MNFPTVTERINGVGVITGRGVSAQGGDSAEGEVNLCVCLPPPNPQGLRLRWGLSETMPISHYT